jgi:IMP dehydrogenase
MALSESDLNTDDRFYQPTKEFFSSHRLLGLTYDDVSLATNYSEILPREVRVETQLSERLRLHIPIISADMDTVTESSMAIAMALNGGLGLIHYNMSEERQAKMVARVKNHVHGLIQDPITVSPKQKIGDLLVMIRNRGFSFRTFPVVNDQGLLLGLLPGRVVTERYQHKSVHEAMNPRGVVYTLNQSEIAQNPIATADKFFTDHMGINKLLIVDDEDRLRGLFTLSDIDRIIEEANAQLKPARGSDFRLVCGAAISSQRNKAGALDQEHILDHAGHLVEEGLDAIAISTAHGHTVGVGEVVRMIRNEFKDITIIAGNVTSGSGVEYLAEAGADVIKVGQGPGSICTTRIVAGVGVPQLTALYVASCAAAKKGIKIIADGGITKSGDMVKALTLADAVMCGGLLAGCRETPGSIIEINGKLYKQYRGMGSLAAMKAGSAARYGHDDFSTQAKVAAEGIEALKELSGSVDEVLKEFVGGIQSGMGYLGAKDLEDLRGKGRFIRVSSAGQREAKPHDIVEVKTTQE